MALVFSDDFSTNDISNYTTSGSPSISGGQLVVTSGGDAITITPAAAGGLFSEMIAQAKFTPSSSGSHDMSLLVRATAAGSVWAQVTNANQFTVKDFYNGGSTPAGQVSFTPTGGTPFWIRAILRGSDIIAEVWAQDPSTAPSSAVPAAVIGGKLGTVLGYGTAGIRLNGNAGDTADDLKLWASRF
jgi:hypothetical protein